MRTRADAVGLHLRRTPQTPRLGFRTPQALARMVEEGCVTAAEAFCTGRPVRVVT